MTNAFDEDGMNILDALSDVGDDTPLGNLSVAVLPIGTCLVDADVHTIEVEVRQLSV